MAFILTVEIDKICRACLTTTEPMKELFSVCSPEVFMDCTSVEISENDCLPNMICDICLDLLNKLYYFKQVVVRSNVILREHGPVIQLPEDFQITEETEITLSENFDKTTDDIICVEPTLPELSVEQNVQVQAVQSYDTQQTLSLPNTTSMASQPTINHEEEHKLTPNTSTDKLECAKCNKTFKTCEKLAEHINQHFGIKPATILVECEVCNKKFGSKKNLISHMRVHTKERRYQCSICGKYFGYLNILKNHELIHAGIKKYACHICDAKFGQAFNLKMHVKTHLNEKSYNCSKCGKSFSQAGNLKDHLIRHTGVKAIACHVCDMRFFVKGDLRKHMLTHSTSKPFPCDVCNKMFKTRSAYDTHMRSHTGERPYECEFCPKKFMTKRDQKNHFMTHTGTKPHKCALCHQAFIQKCSLNRHMKSHMRQAQNMLADQVDAESLNEPSVTVWPEIVI